MIKARPLCTLSHRKRSAPQSLGASNLRTAKIYEKIFLTSPLLDKVDHQLCSPKLESLELLNTPAPMEKP